MAQEMAAALSGAKSVEVALAASQAAADAIMSEAATTKSSLRVRLMEGQGDLFFLSIALVGLACGPISFRT